MTSYPFTVYRFRVVNPMSGKPVVTRYEMTEQEEHESHTVIERLDYTARVITGPSGHTSDFLSNRQPGD
ncbi:hypothetical protein [Denitromonas iodatirespirans]|uniref:Uncharacterized protein n=1 Tax=Denitromonas iodatirespirans TaxID=2795389 RepID=A0A944D8B9_DENI1|nr:hypothetical protein [Denitromonas iodatirespirans]MBT0961685.1 hypothetical protein [Denitromonas iodatirespirans]